MMEGESATRHAFAELEAQFNALAVAAPDAARSFPPAVLAWWLLAPVWPLKIAVRGFRGAQEGQVVQGDDVERLFTAARAQGVLQSAQGEPPWRDTWYWIDTTRGARVRDQLLKRVDGGLELFYTELGNLDYALSRVPDAELPPALQKFRELITGSRDDSGPGTNLRLARILDARVLEALEVAKSRADYGCPEAQRWIEVAAPLSVIFGGALGLATERARRRVELFERRARDRRFLERYTERKELQDAFVELLNDSVNDSWALHYRGDGGMGKTMLIRHITGPLAEQQRLVTSRIDFDHINPDYPSRAPGLLLVALAEDLKLHEDSSVVEHLQRFDIVIADAQIKVEESMHSGSQLDSDVQSRLDEAESLFVDALMRISARSRVVLILDTCEELARIRSNGELSNAVIKTFALLERLHAQVPTMRVVFSGRRDLASTGFGGWKGESGLPERPYLRRAIVEGFRHEETERYFDRLEQRTQKALREGVRDKVRSLSLMGRPDEPEESRRFNPFDLSVYSGWLSDPSVDLEAVHAAGKHHYVRERIVRPLNEWVRPFVPYLAKLGDFDRELVRAIVDLPDRDCETALQEIVAQEWVQRAVASQWQKDEQGQTLQTTWRIEPNVARRMAQYFAKAEEQKEAWQAVQKKLRAILPDLVLARPWSELSVEYFVVAFELLSTTPEKAFDWWRRVELKIVRDGRWEWGRTIHSAIVSRDWALETPGEGGDDGELVWGMLGATDVAMQAKLGIEGQALQSAWSGVRAAVSHLDSPQGLRLRYRAGVGIASSLRWFTNPLAEAYVDELEHILFGVPPMPALSPLSPDEPDVELLTTELGLIDNVIETLDQIEWREAVPESLVRKLEARITRLRPQLPPWMIAFLDCRRVRLAFLAHLPVSDATTSGSGLDVPPERSEFLDWTAPVNLPMRILLELARTARWTQSEVASNELLKELLHGKVADIDTERALSILVRIAADKGSVPEIPELRRLTYKQALEVALRDKPTCAAHRETEPLFLTLLEHMANRGNGRMALSDCDSIAQNSGLPLAQRRDAERLKVKIAARWRLVEVGVGRQTSLVTSNSIEDRVLVAGADAFDPLTEPYQGRWASSLAALAAEGARAAAPRDHVEAYHEHLDAVEARQANDGSAASASYAQPAPKAFHLSFERSVHGIAAMLRGWALNENAQPKLACGPRLAATIALEEAGLLALRVPAAAVTLLSFAAERFDSVGDSLGMLHVSATRALLASGLARRVKTDDLMDDRRALDLAIARCDRERIVASTLLEKLDRSVPIVRTVAPSSRDEDFWESWRIRIAVARGEQVSFKETANQGAFQSNAYRGNAPPAGRTGPKFGPDLAWVFAQRAAVQAPDAAPRTEFAAAPAAAPAAPGAVGHAGTTVSPPPLPPAPARARAQSLWRSAARLGTFLFGTLLFAWLASLLNTLHFRGADGAPGVFGDWGPAWLQPAISIAIGVVLGFGSMLQESPDYKANPATRWKFIRAAFTFTAVLLGLILVVVAGAYLFRGFEWLLQRAEIDLPLGWRWVVFLTVLAVLGLFPQLVKGFARLLERAMRATYTVVEDGDTGAFVVRLDVRVAWLPLHIAPVSKRIDEDVDDHARMYSERARPFDTKAPRMEGRFSRAVRRMFSLRVNADLILRPSDAPLPWEAMLDVRGMQRLCRVGEIPIDGRFRRASPATMMISSTVKDRGESSTYEAWSRGLANARAKFHVGSRGTQTARLDDTQVNVLHILDSVRESSRGLTLEPGDGRQMFPTEVARSFPNLRLVILQLPHRAGVSRSASDRIEAARARKLAGQLFEAGIPAVIVLPSLNEEIGVIVLKRIIEVVAETPRNAKLALMRATEAAQREASAGFSHPSRVKLIEDADGLKLSLAEVPFDFCLYCAPGLSLAVDPGAKR
jgi:hypothetical protein